MKHISRTIVAASLLLVLNATASWARFAPVDEYDETQGHPIRLAAYLVHPIGFAAEWLIARPIHAFVALPGVRVVFGHKQHQDSH